MRNGLREYRRLLVIGNGFDLTCGLKTQYSDFYSWWETHDKDQNLWGPVLDYYQKKGGLSVNPATNWKDLEAVLAVFLNKDIKKLAKVLVSEYVNEKQLFRNIEKEDGKTHKMSFAKMQRERDLALELENVNPKITRMTKYSSDDIRRFFVRGERKVLDDHNQILSIIADRDSNDNEVVYYGFTKEIPEEIYEYWYELFLRDLHSLEKDFTFFLNEQVVDNRSEYDNEAMKLINKIAPSYGACNILSFNFTKPFKSNEEKIALVQNVHGVIDAFAENGSQEVQTKKKLSQPDDRVSTEFGRVVFGIDDKFMYVRNEDGHEVINDNLMRFTKTARIMAFTLSRPNLPILDGVSHIDFYGHSLGEQDYAYFQSIFDTLNIYESEVELCFHFKQFGDEDQFTVTTERVEKLLKQYGESMDNKAKGRNIVQKLLMEGRLYINEIDFDDEVIESEI